MHAKKLISAFLSAVMAVVLVGCGGGAINGDSARNTASGQAEPEETAPAFESLNNPELLCYIEDSVYADLEYELGEDYVIENVTAIYVPFASEEYKQELVYNSQENVFFGYTLSELDEQFQGVRYIFTTDENGRTIVKELEAYDDTYDQVIRNVAVGTGVILVCVTVSVVSGGVGAAPVCAVFATAAKTGTIAALSSGAISGAAAGAVKAYETGGDMDAVMREAALKGSEGFKWGAIVGALAGGATEASALRNAAKATEAVKDSATIAKALPTARESELAALEKLGGREQVTFLNGKEVAYGTRGATRPDIVREFSGVLEAVEVKNYDLVANRSKLYAELEREVAARVENLPQGSKQRILLDVRGRGYDEEFIEVVKQGIRSNLDPIYPKIPIEIME